MADTGMVTTFGPKEPGDRAGAAQTQSLHGPARSLTALLRTTLVCLVVVVVACASWRRNLASVKITPAELLAGTSLGVAGSSPVLVPEEQVLALSPEMRAFLDTHVDRKGGAGLKFHQLVSSVIEARTFGVRYDETTRTASETFRARRGNCLSFSNMFVAMGRGVGLRIEFQEVDIPADWSFDKDTFVLNQHINVYVDLGQEGTRVVDFNIGEFKASYETRRISDVRALLHYYNNIGVERMQAGDTALALSNFRRATADNDRGFSPAWTNLGTLYLRNGHPAHAEAAFLQALKTDKADLVAMSNLERLYEQLGDQERAAAFQKQVARDRWHNPYYRYLLARQAYRARDYVVAISHLKFAIRHRSSDDSFYYLLGLCYREKGDEQAARRWLARAEEVAAASALKLQTSYPDLLLKGTSPP